MSYDLFWNGEPRLFYDYLEVYEEDLKQKFEIEKEKDNYNAWLLGCYIYHALIRVPSMGKPKDYLKKPFEFKEKEDSPKTKEKEISELELFDMRFGGFVEMFNKNNFNKENDK